MGLIRTLQFIARHPMNEGHKLRAVGRFVKWQLGTRLVRSPVVLPWVNGSRLIIERGMTGATGNLYAGLHEFEDMAFLLHLLRPVDHFVDVGANIGSYTILAAAGIGASTTSIEPLPATFRHLVDNVSLNGAADRARCLNIGVAHEEGQLLFTAGLDTVNHVLADGERSEGAVEVPVNRLDDVLEGRQPILMKIDVEGFETNVIRGAERTLGAPSLNALIMELNGSGARYGFDEAALMRTIRDLGFESCKYRPRSRELRVETDSPASDGNVLFVRDVEAVRARLTNAPPFTVNGQKI